ncbi:TetR/AcrR family transcriptional regulator [Piscinibacter sakaiensis]|uniref:TetR/AcrR family transcriptional regulator n=1 Tax=Piscinibacter sakaiensis TaxID=1547922 RepID=UPI003AAD7340
MARSRSAEFAIQRDTIVRTAARLFARDGYPATSMSGLAEACGISKPLLYHYVNDKYQLLTEITDGHVSRLVALVDEVAADAATHRWAPQQHLRQLITRFVEEYALARDDHGVLTQDVKFLGEADRARVLGKERQVVEAFAHCIVAARADWQPADAATLAKPLTMLLFGMMNWLFTWLRPDGPLGHHEMAPVVADLFLGGLPGVELPADVIERCRTA